jgi:hypothetical protein
VYLSEKSIVSMETKITKHEKERSINDKNNSEKSIVYMETKITKHEKERSNNDKNNSETNIVSIFHKRAKLYINIFIY